MVDGNETLAMGRQPSVLNHPDERQLAQTTRAMQAADSAPKLGTTECQGARFAVARAAP
jgi:hypothetical protein